MPSSVDITQVDFNDGDGDPGDRVPDGEAGVGIRAGINDDGVERVGPGGLLDAVNNLALVIRLHRLDRGIMGRGVFGNHPVEVIEGVGSVDFRLTGTEEIQVGAMYDEYSH